MMPVGCVVMYLGPLAPSQVQDKRSTIWPQGAGASAARAPTAGAIAWPQGWLACDGRHVLIAQYPMLSRVLAGVYDTVDTPAGHFTLPDLRGAFVRGVDAGAGVDPDAGTRVSAKGARDAGVGSLQLDALQWHQHDHAGAAGASAQQGGTAVLIPTQSPTSGYVADGGGAVRASSETRPLNVAVYYLIRCR